MARGGGISKSRHVRIAATQEARPAHRLVKPVGDAMRWFTSKLIPRVGSKDQCPGKRWQLLSRRAATAPVGRARWRRHAA